MRYAGRTWVTAATVLAVALVAVRSFVFVAYEHAHFDSDQAVVGLMAHHLAHLQAFPLFFYGQHYLLAVEAWVAAPFLLAFGTSVTTLKLPLLLLNVAIGLGLVRLLVKEEALLPWQALCAALFFVMPTPVTASRLVEAQGANIEPFVYVLLLWVLRRRPIGFGLVFGIGFLHREFTIYAPIALLIQCLWRRTILRGAAARIALTAASAGAVWLVVQLLTPAAANIDDATQPPGLHSVVLAEFPAHLFTLTTENLPVLFGTRSEPLGRFNITSTLAAGHRWVGWLLVAAFATVVVRLIAIALGRPTGDGQVTASRTECGFAVYLVLVGAQALLAHALVSGAGGMLIRYTLLGLLLPIGVIACWLRFDTERVVRVAVIAMLVVTAATALVDHARLGIEYRWRRPPNAYRELAENLILSRASIGRADYWIAYHVSFLTSERVVLDPTAGSRIAAYRERVEADAASAVLVSATPCPDARRLRHWYICTP